MEKAVLACLFRLAIIIIFCWFMLAVFGGQSISQNSNSHPLGPDTSAIRQLLESGEALRSQWAKTGRNEERLLDSAGVCYRSAIALANKLPENLQPDYWTASTHLRQAHLLHSRQLLDSADFFCRQAIHDAQSLADPAISAKLLSEIHWRLRLIGSTYDAWQKPAMAERYFQEANDYFTSVKDTARMTVLAYDLGVLYRQMGYYDKAMDFLDLCGSLANRTGNPEHITRYYIQSGLTHQALGDFFAAKTQFGRGKSLKEEATGQLDPAMSYIYTDLASIYLDLEQYDSALHYYQAALQAIATCKKDNYFCKAYSFIIHENIAATYSQLGQYDQALLSLDRALDSMKIYAVTPADQGRCHRQFGEVHARLGDFEKSDSFFQLSIRELRAVFETDHHVEIANSKLALARLKLLQKQPSEAFEWAEKAEESLLGNTTNAGQRLFEKTLLDILTTKAEAQTALWKSGGEVGRLAGAFATYQSAVSLIDLIRTSFKEKDSKVFLMEKAFTTYENALDVAWELIFSDPKKAGQYAGEALAISEKGKSALLLEATRHKTAISYAGISKETQAEEEKLAADVAYFQKLLTEELLKLPKDQNKENLKWWEGELEKTKTDHDRLLKEIERSSPDYVRLKYDTSPLDAAKLCRSLPDRQTALIEYFAGKRHLYSFKVSKEEGVRMFRLEMDSVLTAHISDFRSVLKTPALQDGHLEQLEKFLQSSRYLYKTLLAEALDGQRFTQLYIVPDGVLNYVPFQLFLTNDSLSETGVSYKNLPYLLRECTVSYEYAASLLLESKKYQWGANTYLGIAPTYEACNGNPSPFKALHYNSAEVASSAAPLNGETLVGPQATKKSFVETGSHFRYLHFAMHATLEEADPMKSALAFTDPCSDGATEKTGSNHLLRAFEIYSLHLAAEVAVLSACNTGEGAISRGEGVMSLSRAFRYAGCPGILMGLWSVNDEAASYIVPRFFENLQANSTNLGSALRNAQLKYLSDNRADHPAFWGVFVVIGQNHALARPMAPWVLWAGLASLAGLAGLGLFLKNKKRGK